MLKILFAILACFQLVCRATAGTTEGAMDPGWLRLVHYKESSSSPSGYMSAIHDESFFLSGTGREDPEAELSATIAAQLAPLAGPASLHAKCRFPARLVWIRQHFPQHAESLQPIACPAFAEWASLDVLDSVSLVLASGYMGNPASYYGHLLLKLNRRDGGNPSYLVDQTVNFGAIDTSRDDPVSYIVKGVVGGYDGGFSPINFYFHEQTYGEIELRDLWEYRLRLQPEEVRYIAAHAWEVMGKRFTYFFFHDNCAMRVAELLEVVDGLEAIPKNRPWIVPQAVLQEVSRATHLGQPLVGAVQFHPSRQTRLYQRFLGLTKGEQQMVGRIIDGDVEIDGGQMRALPVAEQQRVIDTLLDYHQFRKEGRLPQEGGRLPAQYVDALAARLRLPPGGDKLSVAAPTPPHEGHSPSWVQLGMATHESDGMALSLRIRPAYYDGLDVDGAQGKSGSLSMGDIALEFGRGRTKLIHLDLVAIESMTPAETGLPGDRGFGWRLKAGLEQARIGCGNCLAARLQADYSLGTVVGSPGVFAAMHAGGAVQGHADFDGIGFLRIGLSVVAKIAPGIGARASHEIRQAIGGERRMYSTSLAEMRIAIGDSYDLRALWERDASHRLMIGLGAYW